MEFPKDGFGHHGNQSGTLSTWARNTGTDMEAVLDELRDKLSEMRKISSVR